MRRPKSHNENILNYLLGKGRRTSSSSNASYLILYAFLYKYMSDRLKNHLLHEFSGSGDDLEFFYFTAEDEIKDIALKDLGYFFESYDAYIDQFAADKFVDDFFDPSFLMRLKENIIFSKDNPFEEYFSTIIETVERQTKFYQMSYDEGEVMLISNFLSSISKLDISEREFPFQKVYEMISSSRQIRLSPTPNYITQILERIIISCERDVASIYDPFLRDASNLLKVSKQFPGSKIYAKEEDELYYFYSLIRAFINGCDFADISFKRESAIESMAFDEELFDVIVSKIPNSFRHAPDSYRNQNLEAPNPNKVDIKEQLISQFDLSSLDGDEELLNALSVFEKKVEAVEKSNIINFNEEYESLIDSEFLFLINMINCLKEDGTMAVSLSQNFLFKNSLTKLRKFLTYENNYIDTVISLPEVGRLVRPEVIIVFRKNRNRGDILFIDVSKDYGAIPARIRIPGAFRNNLVFDDKTLDRIIDVFVNRKRVDRFSEVISISDLEKNEFSLAVSRYVDTYEGKFIRLEDLESRKRDIDSKMDELSDKISFMMDDLNLR
ncbi:N-6 DNA methylase [Methanobrevibacter sp.]|uniref:N-6 DNA methylase n=1 Tax=Methanobrevibacter sp. TaxID=66852 RepID=UPI00386A7C3A